MEFLEKYGFTEEDIEKITNKYSPSLISSFIYKEKNVCLLLDYFKDLEFDIKTIIFNRLDIFLIDYLIIKEKMQANLENIDILRNDISLLDNLV